MVHIDIVCRIPLQALAEDPRSLDEFWKKYVTDTERLFENFGHPSGIPQDWDGRVYRMPVDLI